MAEQPMIYFHCSDHKPDVGTVFEGRKENYEKSWAHTDFYKALEKYRPLEKIAHKDGVFVCRDLESLFLCGGGEEAVLLMEVESEVHWHDMNWSSEISCLISDGYSIESKEVKKAAECYWAGEPHPNESVWEGITKSARVVAIYDFDESDLVLEKARNSLSKKSQKRDAGLQL